MNKEPEMTSSQRPPALRLRNIPQIDPVSGDYIFRFPLPVADDVPEDNRFRWVVEEQLRALLDLVELADQDQPLRVTQYRFLNEGELRDLYPRGSDRG